MWSGSVLLDPGRLVYCGWTGFAHRHSHAAVLLALVTSGRVTIADSAGQRVTMTAAVLPVGAVHEMHGLFARCVLAYLDPASTAGARLGQLTSRIGDPLSADAWVRAAEPITRLTTSEAPIEPRALVQRAIDALIGSTDTTAFPVNDHPALRAALELLPQKLDGGIRLADVAQAVGLSADRLGRLFADRLGLSFPAYVRWLRLRVAITQVRGGATLTEAAHAAGFADSAHLTRVSREMFGMAPSAIARRIRWAD